ncbi:phage tail tape measure protein [Desemzia incerta]|uniref:phage tail tape measure protein n=1 Tax=Desemzia incerta TaxID=82801 RepID=UPI003D0172FF
MADYTLSAKLTADGSGFSKVFKDAFNQSEKLSNGIKNTGKEITGFGKNMTLTGAGMTAGFTMPFVKAIQTTGDFEAAMTKAGVIAGATSGELGQMTDAALELGATTSLSSNEVAEAMTEMAAKGFDATQVIAAMPGVISAAEASGEELALTADVVASALNGFGLEAGDSGKVADILAMAANKTAAGVGDMGEAFKYSAPLASSLGISMEELSAATGLMVDAGLGGGQAGTTLRQALISLTKPTAKSANLMADLGFSAVDAQGNFKSLEQIVAELNGSMKGMTEAQKLSALATIFGTEAASGMNILLSAGQEELAGLTKELENSEGASAEAAKAMKDNLNGVLDNLGGAIESATISVMSKLTPFIADVASFVTEMVEKFNNLSDGAQTMIGVGALIVAALGPVLTILGVMTMGIGGLVTAFGFLISPIGLAIAAIIGLGAAFGHQMIKNAEFRNSFIENFDSIKEKVTDIFNAITGVISRAIGLIGPMFSLIGELLNPAIESIKVSFGSIGEAVAKMGSLALTGFLIFGGGISKVLTFLQPLGAALSIAKGYVIQFVSAIMANGPLATFSNILSKIPALLGALISPIGIAVAVIGSLVGAFTYLMATSSSFRETVMNTVSSIMANLIPAFASVGLAITNIANTAIPIFSNLLAMIMPVMQGILEVLMNIAAGLAPLISVLIGALMPAITNIITAFMNIIQAVAPAFIIVFQLIVQAVSAVIPIFLAVATTVIQVISTIISTVSTIISFTAMVISAIMAIITPIVGFIASIISGIIGYITPIIAVVSGIFSTVVTVISGAFRMAQAVASTVFASISKTINNLTGVVGKVFSNIIGTVSSVMGRVGSVISGIFDSIKNSWNGLTTFVSGVFSGIGSSVETLVGQVKGFVNGVIGGINSAVSLINKIPGVSIGSIPYLARGTDDFQGGFARINEGGRGELVSMPGGTQVIPHDVSMRYAREAGKQSSVSNAIDSKSKVMIPNENSKQSMNLTLNMGSKSFRGFVDDISNTQNAQIQLTESYL